MNNNVSTKLMGGLGNYLFQISAAYAIAIRDKKEFICDISDEIIIHTPFIKYTNNFLRNIKYVETPLNLPVYDELSFNYNQIKPTIGDLKIIGYFQSEKYFKDYELEIKKLFEPDDFEKKYLEEKYGDILKLETVSLHIRRGNYIEKKYYHENQSLDYYKNAISLFNEENHYLIFSDDIDWCKESFNFLKNKTFIDGNLDYQDLILMSLCKNNIIANSSFSWWGAWLNKNNNKVVAPSKWFGPGLSHNNTKDLYCDNWIIL